MKKIISAFTSIFLISCWLTVSTEAEDEIRYSKNVHLIRQSNLQQKSALDLQWALVDQRTNEILVIIELIDLDYNRETNQLNQLKVQQFVRDLAKNIDQPLINPSISRDGKIKEGQNKVILSEKELLEQMLSLRYYNKQLFLPIYEEEPTLTKEDLVTIKDALLSSYVTYFNPNTIGRSINIKLSSDAIDHYILAPNEVFSFNEVVGERTKQRGYQEATEIVNQLFVTGIGGGICQTSSTLYNAIDYAKLDVVERHAHSNQIDYVPKGRDATVSWGGPDFKFRNPYQYPLLISTVTDLNSGKIEVKLFGSLELEKDIVAAR